MQPNQFTKAEEEGKPKPPGANQFTKGTRDKHDQATKDRIRAEVAAQYLEEVLTDKEVDHGTKVAASKALLPYGKSTYASIEQRQLDENAGKTEEEIIAELRTLFLAKPELLARLNLAWKPGTVDVQEQQSTAA
jgi:hypothetical protein